MGSPTTDHLQIVVPPGDTLRIDVLLARSLPNGSRAAARRLLESGSVAVNGRRPRKGAAVRPGDVVQVQLPAHDEIGAEESPVAILYEDEAIVAVDKPPAMPAVALRSDDHGTLANFLVGRYPELRGAGSTPQEAGLVHRIDTGTSGVLVAARNPQVHAELRRQFSSGEVRKHYLALVEGDVNRAGTVGLPIAHVPRRKRRMCVCPNPAQARSFHARPASTIYRPLERFGAMTFLSVEIETGVRHQIRVHLAAAGHPIVGDTLYGRPAARAPRPLLHASSVSFRHPLTHEIVTIEAPLCADFVAFLEKLGSPQRGWGREPQTS